MADHFLKRARWVSQSGLTLAPRSAGLGQPDKGAAVVHLKPALGDREIEPSLVLGLRAFERAGNLTMLAQLADELREARCPQLR
jgi:hypothetical protein